MAFGHIVGSQKAFKSRKWPHRVCKSAIGSFARLIFHEKGNTAIEFAIVAPVMLLLVFGIIEFSFVMATSAILEGAILTAAREGSTGYVPSGQTQDAYIASVVKARVGGFLDPNKLIITIPTASDNPGQIVQYKVSYPWPIVTNLLQKVIATNGVFMITATAVVQNEFFP